MATFISAQLSLVGLSAITYSQAIGSSSYSEVQANWGTLAEYIPVFLILASPGLFKDPFLVEMSRDALAGKKAIPIIFVAARDLPTWFSVRAITLSGYKKEIDRSWNRLISALHRYVAILVEPQLRPN